MATQQGKTARGRIEILLPSRPKRLYCSGPPPPPITLLPPRDSTAYIVSKLVLPSALETAAERTTRRRLYYTVGWTDLPSAKVAVLASRILDYVSPRELEDWEYNDFLRREEEKRLAKLEAAVTPVTPVKKKKSGRPRKGPSDSQREAEAAVAKEAAVLDSETEAILAEKKAGGEPSLSTPSKRKLEELLRETEAEETGEESENAAVARQLYSEGEEGGYRLEPEYEEQMDIDSEAVDLLAPVHAGEDMSSRASSLATPIPAPFVRASPAFSSSLKPGSADSSVASAPASLPDTKSKSAAGGVKQVSTLRNDVKPRSRTTSRASTPRTSAYLPAPSTNGAPPPRRESTGFTPVITPVPVPVLPSSFITASPVVSNINNQAVAASSAEASQPPPTSTKKRPPKKRKREKTKKQATEERWEVKRLEGDKYHYDEAGNLVRYFKVRWEGDWPAWQNPSWEPEENITKELREEYLAQQETKMKNGYLTTGKSPAKSSPAKPRPFLPQKRYSSVAEAFEGGMHELEAAKGAGPEEDDGQGEEETFVVTDEPQPKPGKQPAPNFSAFDQKLASYRDTFGRGGLGN